MKARSITLGVVLSVSVIVLSLVAPVNHSSQPQTHGSAVLVADGVPGPPLPPPPPPVRG
ncbi:MAG: hypothetical protein WBL63_04825 [Candidatus Acidiferrum sp.]